jgi:hypothetical protein
VKWGQGGQELLGNRQSAEGQSLLLVTSLISNPISFSSDPLFCRSSLFGATRPFRLITLSFRNRIQIFIWVTVPPLYLSYKLWMKVALWVALQMGSGEVNILALLSSSFSIFC